MNSHRFSTASRTFVFLVMVVCFLWTTDNTFFVISLMISSRPTTHRVGVEDVNRRIKDGRKSFGLAAMNKDEMAPPIASNTRSNKRQFLARRKSFIRATQQDDDDISTSEEEPDDMREEEEGDSDVNDMLLDKLRPSKDCKVNRMGGTDLAYIGDVVFELYVRSKLVWPSRRTSDLQNLAVSIVRAENQSFLLAQVKDNFPLTETETQVVSRGRNAVTRSKNRRNPAAYQDSTAFEALIGYLYITDRSRCNDLFEFLENIITVD